MASLNKVILLGNLGADPELRHTGAGDPVCQLRLATTDRYKDRSGQMQEATEWHRVVLFRRLAEVASEYLKKGAAVYIEGRIKTRKWQDNQGQDRYTTEIEATEMKMLGGSRNGERPPAPPRPSEPGPAGVEQDPWVDGPRGKDDYGITSDDDDYPF